MTATLYANTELVAVAWIKELGLTAGTTLPDNQSSWPDGFVQVTSLAGNINPYVGMRYPIVSIDTWAVPKGNKPPWGKANNIAETIITAGLKARPHRVTLAGDFPKAQLFTVDISGCEPRRIIDPGGFARYNFNIRINWAPVSV